MSHQHDARSRSCNLEFRGGVVHQSHPLISSDCLCGTVAQRSNLSRESVWSTYRFIGSMMISTRRLSALPWAVSLDETGMVLPTPRARILSLS
jgi:hypothetical protein